MHRLNIVDANPGTRKWSLYHSRAQLFKTNYVISWRILKTSIIKYGIYANIFAEKMWVAFAFAKATHIFSAKTPVN